MSDVSGIILPAFACGFADGLQIEQLGDFIACEGTGFGTQAYE